MRTILPSTLAAFGCLLGANLAFAHISASTPTPYSEATAEVSFSVGHGCEGLDTQSVKITIPASVTAVRVVEHSSFPLLSTESGAAGITSVTFSKPQTAVRATDDAFYKLVLRVKLPKTPFGPVYFPTLQTCKSADGATTKTTEWVAEAGATGDVEPAPAILVLPARVPGWNKYTIPAGVEIKKEQLATIFKDALIVWAGDTAYSINPNTAALIEGEAGVETLESIAAGTELWVKY